VHLFNGRILFSKSKLVRWYDVFFFFSIIIFSLFNSNFSNSFETTESSDIGLREVTSFNGFPGLGIIITMAIFHTCGVYFNLKEALIR
jgi:hypothetical protein